MSLDRLEDRLREMLNERSVLPPANPIRHDEVERRIGRRRRARIAGLSAVAAVAATGASAGVLALPSRGPASQVSAAASRPAAGASPAPSQSPPPLPEYSAGYHRISQQQIALPGTAKLLLTYTPETLDFKVGFNCAAVPGQLLVLAVNGVEAGSRMCGGGPLPGTSPSTDPPANGSAAAGSAAPVFWLGGSDRDADYHSWKALKVAVGRPSTFVITVGRPIGGLKDQNPSAGPPTAAGDVYAGVYLPVPFDQYPLPPRPEPLRDLDAQVMPATSSFPHALGLLDSRKLDSPDGSHSVTLVMPEFLAMNFCAVAPGQVELLVDGQPAGQATFWDWDGSCYSGGAVADNAVGSEPPPLKHVHRGQKVVVSVVTSGFVAGGWRVGFDQSP